MKRGARTAERAPDSNSLSQGTPWGPWSLITSSPCEYLRNQVVTCKNAHETGVMSCNQSPRCTPCVRMCWSEARFLFGNEPRRRYSSASRYVSVNVDAVSAPRPIFDKVSEGRVGSWLGH